MLALAGQLLLGAIVPRGASAQDLEAIRLAEGAVPICHGIPQPSDDAPAPPAHHGDDCALCPLCVALTAPAILSAPPAPPLPRIVLARHAAPLPPARAPPTLDVLATHYPTGPPRLA